MRDYAVVVKVIRVHKTLLNLKIIILSNNYFLYTKIF